MESEERKEGLEAWVKGERGWWVVLLGLREKGAGIRKLRRRGLELDS